MSAARRRETGIGSSLLDCITIASPGGAGQRQRRACRYDRSRGFPEPSRRSSMPPQLRSHDKDAHMAQIRHIAIASDHPFKAAEFYKKAFGFREIARNGFDPSKPDE